LAISLELILLVLSFLFFISILASKAGFKFGVPVLLLFLIIGMVSGTDGLGIQFDNYHIAQVIGTLALCMILFSGGLDTKMAEIKPVLGPGIVLATLGVLLTTLITGLIIWWICGMTMKAAGIGFLTSILLASTMSSTDSASVFATLRSKKINIRQNLKPLLELESGSNDPMAFLLTITFIEIVRMGEQPGFWFIIGKVAYQLITGAVAGYLLGKLTVIIINKIEIGYDSLYPILVFTASIFIYSVTWFLNGNGFLAIYTGGLIIGNSRFIHKKSSVGFFDGLAWLSQILLFLTLGLLVNPRELLPVLLPGLLISLALIFVSRPIAVFLSLLPFRKISPGGKLFISWVGLRGAVPIIFAIYTLDAGIPEARFIFNIVFFTTLVSLVVQGTTLAQVARWLGLAKEFKPSKPVDFDFESDEIKSVRLEAVVTAKTVENGNRLIDLALPEKTLVVLVKREHTYFVPSGNTTLVPGDKLLMITDDYETLAESCRERGISGFRITS
jgi:cell volume regulation protein A